MEKEKRTLEEIVESSDKFLSKAQIEELLQKIAKEK